MRSQTSEKIHRPIGSGISIGWMGWPAMLAGVRMTPPRDYREKKQRACGGWEAGGPRGLLHSRRPAEHQGCRANAPRAPARRDLRPLAQNARKPHDRRTFE